VKSALERDKTRHFGCEDMDLCGDNSVRSAEEVLYGL
jgi:hypothetical protein